MVKKVNKGGEGMQTELNRIMEAKEEAWESRRNYGGTDMLSLKATHSKRR